MEYHMISSKNETNCYHVHLFFFIIMKDAGKDCIALIWCSSFQEWNLISISVQNFSLCNPMNTYANIKLILHCFMNLHVFLPCLCVISHDIKSKMHCGIFGRETLSGTYVFIFRCIMKMQLHTNCTLGNFM